MERLHSLSSLRFLAASAVVIYHLLPGWVGAAYLSWPKPLLNLLSSAYLGLPFFYALSGFILYYVYHREIPASARERLLFWGRRFARIAPIFYLSLLLGAWPFVRELLGRHGEGEGAVRALAYLGVNVAFLSAWLPETLDFNFPTWSISVEMFCYALFPFLLPVAARLSRLDAWKSLFACYAAGASIQLAGVLAHPELVSWPYEISHLSPRLTNFLQLHPVVHLPEFLFGLLLGRLFELRGRRESGDLALAVGALLVLVIVQCGVRWPFLMMTSFLFLPVEGLLLWGGAGARGPFTRWLESPVAVLLGESTYAIYVLHVPLGYWWSELVGTGRPYLSFAAFFVFLCLVSVALHLRFELPLRARLARWFAGRLA